ncbi:SDR family NAD(P)-dependent oxidoreductase [Pseudomonas sp. NA-150]|uniref:SDR family NAD(P)-dependent oxidoreductase n=1 Tax=Pseudomonas sp. NA-150 TaxID=3367525 RepID=UPI0037CC84F4
MDDHFMTETLLKLSGKVALITGGSSGIGLATAHLMHAQGASVVIVGRDATKLDEALLTIGPRASGVVADVSSVADIDRVMAAVSERHGHIDVLFANAGTSHNPPLREVDEAAFDSMIGLNFKGVFFTVARALPLLANGASVILTGSAAADMGRWGDPLYAATKAAVRSLARTFANDEELTLRRVRFNVLSPGAIKTPLTQGAYEQPDVDAYVCAAVPMKRWGNAEEIASAALFLACADSSYMTGSILAIDGGMAQV